MKYPGWKSVAWLVAGTFASLGATAQTTAAIDAALEKACSDVAPSVASVDLDALSQRMNDVQAASTGTGHEEACTGWRHVMRTPSSAPLLKTDWASKVAASLVWLGRSAEAEPLLDAAYASYSAAGPAQSDNAGMVAGMLTVIWVQRGQLDTSLQWSQRAVDAVRSPGSTVSVRDRLRLVLNHCSLLSRARRYEDALPLAKAAHDEALAQPEPLYAEAASALNTLSTLSRRLSRLADSLAYTEREIALRRAHVADDSVTLANSMQNRGVILMGMARFDEAESALKDALDHARAAQASGAVDLMGHQASIRETLSGLLLARGRPADALQAAQDAVATLAGRPEASMARGARPLRRLAEAQLALGELSQGVATYRRAIALLSTAVGAPEADDAMAIRLGYTLAMIELGELEEAQATVQLIAADKRPRTAEESARLQVLQATLAQRRGDTPAAAAAWLAADQALSTALPPEHPDRRFILTQACELGATACPPATATGKPDTDALVQMALGRKARAAGDAPGADTAARAAVAAAMASGQPRLQWQALALWADVLADAGRRQQAIFVGKLALSQLQQQRQRLLPLGSLVDTHYLADKTPLYRRVADWLLQDQRIPEALEVMRLLKQQEQADFNERGLAETAGSSGIAFNEAEQAAWRRFESALQGGDKQAEELRLLSDRAAAQRITGEESARLGQLRRDVDMKRDASTTRLNEVLTGLDATGRAAPPRSLGRMKRPAVGQLYAYTLAGERHLSLLLVGAKDTQLHELDLTSIQLARQVSALRDALASNSDGVQPLAQALYSRIGKFIDAAAKRNRARQIVVWLDGPLRYLPPGLMQDGGQALATRYRWVIAGGLNVADLPSAPQRTSQPRMAAFGVTQAFQGLPALPAVADELCNIVDGPVKGLDDVGQKSRCGANAHGHGLIPGQGLLNGLFTEASLTRARAAKVPGAGNDTAGDLLHISTHFVLRPGSVGKSWLLLGDGSRLSLERMRSLDLGSPRLVTLSACETAVTDAVESSGREVDGLAAALLDRGARQVLASLWRVDDRATARFMQRFYAAYAANRGHAADALHEAQRQTMAEGATAKDWAAFVLLAKE